MAWIHPLMNKLSRAGDSKQIKSFAASKGFKGTLFNKVDVNGPTGMPCHLHVLLPEIHHQLGSCIVFGLND